MRAEFAPVVEPEALGAWADDQRAAGRSIVFTNGCFDLLHAGHVQSLREAATHGDVLLVATNSDASVHVLKGEGRPVLTQDLRVRLLGSLRWVDAVTIFDDPSVLQTLATVRPDVVAKGGEYEESAIVGSAEIAAWGGRIVRLPMVAGLGTTQLLSHIRNAPGAAPFRGKDEG